MQSKWDFNRIASATSISNGAHILFRKIRYFFDLNNAFFFRFFFRREQRIRHFSKNQRQKCKDARTAEKKEYNRLAHHVRLFFVCCTKSLSEKLRKKKEEIKTEENVCQRLNKTKKQKKKHETSCTTFALNNIKCNSGASSIMRKSWPRDDKRAAHVQHFVCNSIMIYILSNNIKIPHPKFIMFQNIWLSIHLCSVCNWLVSQRPEMTTKKYK